MDFFQAQEEAKRNTAKLILLFSLAVFSLIIMTNLLVMFLFGYMDSNIDQPFSFDLLLSQLNWEMFFFISIVVISVVLAGSVYKTMSLNSGGKAIAEMLGGHVVNRDTRDLDKKKLLNVVEEMAIASGTPVPAVYVLEQEYGINAFAAGFKSSDAVIGVTKGCIEQLSREELQAVIAHEFSHILNGDMRLNMRLIGILHGILLLGYIGYYVLRSSPVSRKNTMPLMGLGFGLIVIGFGGNFFGNLIKSSVSRQREYLADSSAVQFTRSKDGITNALYKISNIGSNLDSPLAPQMSHAYFSNGASSFIGSMFATHPPIENRITRIRPYFFIETKIKKQEKSKNAKQQETKEGVSSLNTQEHTQQTQRVAEGRVEGSVEGIVAVSLSQQMINSVGTITDKQVNSAQKLLHDFPKYLYQASHNINQARAMVFCLLLDDKSEILTKQLMHIKSEEDDNLIDHVLSLRSYVNELEIRFRLPLIDLIIPTLKELSLEQYQTFKSTFEYLIHADQRIDTFEWILYKVLFQTIDKQYSNDNQKRNLDLGFEQRLLEINFLISLLCYEHIKHEDDIQVVLEKVRAELNFKAIKLIAKGDVERAKTTSAMATMVDLKPNLKAKVLRATLLILTNDKVFSLTEKELLRAVSAMLDCPMPIELTG